MCSNSTSTCSGVLPSKRKSCVSVSIFVGIKLSIAIFKGRMSCKAARSCVITKMFSDSKTSMAGKSACIRIGIAFFTSVIYTII